MYFVYLLKSKLKTDQLYTGYSVNVEKRLERHNKGLVDSTRPYRPWELIHYEAFKNKSNAKRREQYLKTTKGRRALRLMLKDSLK